MTIAAQESEAIMLDVLSRSTLAASA